MSRRNRQHGFTFLELTLAMAMVSMLALSLYASLRIGFRARDSATQAIGPARAAEIAMELIRGDLESALPPTGVMAGSFIGEHNAGSNMVNDMLQFYCVGEGPEHPDPTGWGGIRRIELGVTTLADGTPNVLVRRITGNLLSPMVGNPDEEVLCRGVRSFTLRYWDGYTWQDVWDSTQMDNMLPAAVEARLELDWPPQQRPSPDAQPTYRAIRIVSLACYRDLDAEAANAPAGSGASPGAGGSSQGGGR